MRALTLHTLAITITLTITLLPLDVTHLDIVFLHWLWQIRNKALILLVRALTLHTLAITITLTITLLPLDLTHLDIVFLHQPFKHMNPRLELWVPDPLCRHLRPGRLQSLVSLGSLGSLLVLGGLGVLDCRFILSFVVLLECGLRNLCRRSDERLDAPRSFGASFP